jgi:hypothetical protein
MEISTNIIPSNFIPVVAPNYDTYVTKNTGPLRISLQMLAFDMDDEDERLFYHIVKRPTLGTISLAGRTSDGRFALSQPVVYTPFNDTFGIDSIQYCVSDLKGNSSTGVITIDIRQTRCTFFSRLLVFFIKVSSFFHEAASNIKVTQQDAVYYVEQDSVVVVDIKATSPDTQTLSYTAMSNSQLGDYVVQKTGHGAQLIFKGKTLGREKIQYVVSDGMFFVTVDLYFEVTKTERKHEGPTSNLGLSNQNKLKGCLSGVFELTY